MKYPNFLVLGTQKGGTTTLHKLLKSHKGVFLPEKKEIHYFTLNYDKPNSWYGEHYKYAKWGEKKGDITPYYLFHPKAPERIKKLIPRAKLIILLRNPVERTLSQIFHAKRHGFEYLDVKGALEAEQNRLESGSEYSLQKYSYLARSCYLNQMDRYERLFKKEQILVLKSEDLFYNPQRTWMNIENFLRIRHNELPDLIPKENSGDNESMNVSQAIKNSLRDKLTETITGVKERYNIEWY